MLGSLLHGGCTVALGDGFGTPQGAFRELSDAARAVGGVRLLLGWMPKEPIGLDFTAFADVRTVMPGWGLRKVVAAGLAHFVPIRLSQVSALIHNVMRPDVLVATVVPTRDGYTFANEISWQQAAVDAGAVVAAITSSAAPTCTAGVLLPADQVVVIGSTDQPPGDMPRAPTDPITERLAAGVLPQIREGTRLQVGPGALGSHLLLNLTVPVRIDSGLLPDEVVDLDERGLLLGEPAATYLAGGPRLRNWADGRPILHPIEYTHDISRLSADPFVAVNTAVEIDVHGQINVEGTATAVFGGIGGHGDYAAAAASTVGGVSIIAVATTHNSTSTLVSSLSRPVSTPAHDVGIVVTEHGSVDLRGLDRIERTAALTDLWGEAGIRQQKIER
ncbi:acetyl-CoA hydrolase/transferase C-terminal domain-containing protein [Rhodococcoides yunnanense]|uniref:Acetyl-CoA hydrolase/transferase C-terminal domain-containing protein n=1 Tax=Rhodococcoides yunnanense TaxID=278209 RepID=A0ABU4BKI8_9NOCA|nr:acetyl-CoA hydrolase/transferase C-terminal domain-containing protein [Rhodococcus yunnanensis]MDV6264741.1 acetyl-CoA hydrolase/transferase C-terminal domain-containing protein [Rhodococcus yunnanensis]